LRRMHVVARWVICDALEKNDRWVPVGLWLRWRAFVSLYKV
jgi:hypothetical protein